MGYCEYQDCPHHQQYRFKGYCFCCGFKCIRRKAGSVQCWFVEYWFFGSFFDSDYYRTFQFGNGVYEEEYSFSDPWDKRKRRPVISGTSQHQVNKKEGLCLGEKIHYTYISFNKK